MRRFFIMAVAIVTCGCLRETSRAETPDSTQSANLQEQIENAVRDCDAVFIGRLVETEYQRTGLVQGISAFLRITPITRIKGELPDTTISVRLPFKTSHLPELDLSENSTSHGENFLFFVKRLTDHSWGRAGIALYLMSDPRVPGKGALRLDGSGPLRKAADILRLALPESLATRSDLVAICSPNEKPQACVRDGIRVTCQRVRIESVLAGRSSGTTITVLIPMTVYLPARRSLIYLREDGDGEYSLTSTVLGIEEIEGENLKNGESLASVMARIRGLN